MDKMDLDAALNELGMLSTVTDIRKDYLNEQAKQRSSSFNLVQLNPTYVTCLGPARHVPKPKSRGVEVEEAPRSLRASGSVPNLQTDDNRVARHQRSKCRYSRPYHIPKHATATSGTTGRLRRTTEPSGEEKESGGRKNSLGLDSISLNVEMVPSVSFLTRSKSVDDLSKRENSVQVRVNSGVSAQHQEMEMVSRNLKNLQMSSSH